MSAIARIALADWRARTRTFAFVIVAAFALEFAYLFVPDARAGYRTVSMGSARGIYNAAWMGAMCAMCTVSVLALIGFYLVRGAVSRDERAGTAGIVAASPVTGLTFVAGKWASNVSLLGFLALILLGGCIVMQQVRGESRSFDVTAYLLPFALVVVPTCGLVAAFAVLFDVLRPLRGAWGAVLWFALASAAFSLPAANATAGRTVFLADPSGIGSLIGAMNAAAHAALPSKTDSGVAIGVVAAPRAFTFVWGGMHWSAQLVLARLAWSAVAVALVAIAGLAFDRYTALRAASRAFRWHVARILPNVKGLQLVRAEMTIVAGGIGFWPGLIAGVLGVAGAFVPLGALEAGVLPIAFAIAVIVYTQPVGNAGAEGFRALVLSAPHAATRSIVARIAAAGLLGCIPLAGALIRLPALAIVPFASAAIAMALAPIAKTPRAFEASYLVIWYAGVLNHVPLIDVTADAVSTPIPFALFGMLAICAAAIVARMQLRPA